MTSERGNTKKIEDFLETWHSGQSAVNKHIEIDAIIQPTKKAIRDFNATNQVKANQNKCEKKDRTSINNNQLNKRQEEKATSHLWRKSRCIFLTVVCADEVIQIDNDNPATKLTGSESAM